MLGLTERFGLTRLLAGAEGS